VPRHVRYSSQFLQSLTINQSKYVRRQNFGRGETFSFDAATLTLARLPKNSQNSPFFRTLLPTTELLSSASHTAPTARRQRLSYPQTTLESRRRSWSLLHSTSDFGFALIRVSMTRLDEREDGSAIQDYLQEKTGQRTVPNIFIGAQPMSSPVAI
jgi:hypothetical protein